MFLNSFFTRVHWIISVKLNHLWKISCAVIYLFSSPAKIAFPGGAAHVAAVRVTLQKLNAKQESFLLKCHRGVSYYDTNVGDGCRRALAPHSSLHICHGEQLPWLPCGCST